MLSYLFNGANDVEASARFYDALYRRLAMRKIDLKGDTVSLFPRLRTNPMGQEALISLDLLTANRRPRALG
ncbi:hypothetical protein V0M98_23880 [Pseudomonas silesiensis]|uniref:hypothetical protein n=1 Tax=Pseudomonas silesiensis TaxID=1853130 RepID=UPI0030CB6C8B